ncbi:hypothetical protein DL98DRAFT_595488 [Cadophora sp. DSE1049]|nr:hypothetical protein DL98DRAFT_595488 [Cadophora sp. DSE1049]
MAGNTYSTSAVNGSPNELTPTSPPQRTLAQIAAEKPDSLSRLQTFVADLNTSIVSLSLDSNSKVASRVDAAQASIVAFDAAFKDNTDASK